LINNFTGIEVTTV